MQVGLRQLNELSCPTGQDGPGRVKGEPFDLTVVELWRQRELMAGDADVNQSRPVVAERFLN